jgi:hypothetical protein
LDFGEIRSGLNSCWLWPRDHEGEVSKAFLITGHHWPSLASFLLIFGLGFPKGMTHADVATDQGEKSIQPVMARDGR